MPHDVGGAAGRLVFHIARNALEPPREPGAAWAPSGGNRMATVGGRFPSVSPSTRVFDILEAIGGQGAERNRPV